MAVEVDACRLQGKAAVPPVEQTTGRSRQKLSRDVPPEPASGSFDVLEVARDRIRLGWKGLDEPGRILDGVARHLEAQVGIHEPLERAGHALPADLASSDQVHECARLATTTRLHVANAMQAGIEAEAATAEGVAEATRFEVALEDQDALVLELGEATFGVGGLFLCSLLYRSRLIPRFLAVGGFIRYMGLMAGTIAETFGIHVGLMLSAPGRFGRDRKAYRP